MRMVVNGLTAITVMAFAGTASAIPTYDIQNGNILAIGNLELNFDNDELDGLYNITFVTDEADDQYGDANFDFATAEQGTTAAPQITQAINDAPQDVTGASAEGSDIYFIPLVEIPLLPVWGAVGSENINGIWGDCKDGCILGVRPVGIGAVNT